MDVRVACGAAAANAREHNKGARQGADEEEESAASRAVTSAAVRRLRPYKRFFRNADFRVGRGLINITHAQRTIAHPTITHTDNRRFMRFLRYLNWLRQHLARG